MRVNVEIKDDRQLVDRLINEFNINEEHYVGLFKDTPTELARGVYDEFGTSKAPPRPFIKPTILSNEKMIIRNIESNLRKLNTPSIFMQNMANIMVEKVKHRIDVMKHPVLSKSTIERKGHGMLLKDTYEMYDAIKTIKIDYKS